jgi:NAD-dependent SIR2 family protein deacetylase
VLAPARQARSSLATRPLLHTRCCRIMQKPISWSDADGVRQQELLSAIAREIDKRNCCLFVGAGASVPAGYPHWLRLIEDLGGAAGLRPPQVNDTSRLLAFADECRSTLGETRYHRFLECEFDPKGRDGFRDIHAHLVKIPFSAIVTTNYDPCLEKAAEDAADMRTVVHCYPYLESGYLRSGDERHIYHLHGRAYDEHDQSRVGSIVLTERDYEGAYGQNSPIRRLLEQVLQYHTIVFLGASLDDPFLRQVLREAVEVSNFLAYEATRREEPAPPPGQRFALLRADSSVRDQGAERLQKPGYEGPGFRESVRLQELRIVPVYYHAEHDDRYHSELTRIALNLRNRTATPTLSVVGAHTLRA